MEPGLSTLTARPRCTPKRTVLIIAMIISTPVLAVANTDTTAHSIPNEPGHSRDSLLGDEYGKLSKPDIFYDTSPTEYGLSPVFQVGSGAGAHTRNRSTAFLAKEDWNLGAHTRNRVPNLSMKVSLLIALIGAITISCILCLMPDHHRHHRGHHHHHHRDGNDLYDRSRSHLPQLANSTFNDRVPPEWGPEADRRVSFRAWQTDVALWSYLTNLEPHQQCAAIIMRLTGAAREQARTLTDHEIRNGGVMGGVQLDPVGYLMAGREMRFGQLDEETRMAAMNEFMAFARRRHENINEVLSRFELVRDRARLEGNFVMSVEGCALQLLRALNISHTQLSTLLQPFGMRFPGTEQELQQLYAQLRRQGHITEGLQNNLASTFNNPHRQAHAGSYFTHGGSGILPLYPIIESGEEWESTYAGWSGSGATSSTGVPPSTDNIYLGDEASSQPPDESSFSSSDATGTDTDTSSDRGETLEDDPTLYNVPEDQLESEIFYRYKTAKRRWRRFVQKPTRKFRRKLKRFKRYAPYRRKFGQARGHTRRRRFRVKRGDFRKFHISNEETEVFIQRRKAKAKEKGKGSSNDFESGTARGGKEGLKPFQSIETSY